MKQRQCEQTATVRPTRDLGARWTVPVLLQPHGTLG
jgi:hypothetical protein